MDDHRQSSLGIANHHPFHIPHRVPASFGACVLPPSRTELIAVIDIASHLGAAASGFEHLSTDGATWQRLPELALKVQAEVHSPPWCSALAPLGVNSD